MIIICHCKREGKGEEPRKLLPVVTSSCLRLPGLGANESCHLHLRLHLYLHLASTCYICIIYIYTSACTHVTLHACASAGAECRTTAQRATPHLMC